jgi:hypothetical protein
MSFAKFIAKISRSSLNLLTKTYNFLNAVLSGFWLGVMNGRSLNIYNELHYNKSQKYQDDNYNLSGLFKWEKENIERHFSNTKNILLIAAGGGRETFALSKMGYEVDSYECNRVLCEYGNTFLRKNHIDSEIKYLPGNSVPDKDKNYNGIIIGWGAYSHIIGHKQRINFLAELYPLLVEGMPLMISFLVDEKRGRQEIIIKNVSNFFRNFSGRDKTEPGDRLMSHCVHFFNEEEIKNELIQAKFKVVDYYNIDYGCIIAVK